MHPGPIDNRNIADYFLKASVLNKENNEKAFFVSKSTFYFFQSLYGGGPAVVENTYFDVFTTVKPQLLSQFSDKFEE